MANLWLFTLSVLLSVLSAAGAPSVVAVGQNEYQDPHCGGRQVIVLLFEWRWPDVAEECERYLGPNNFCGVQVSPPNEHVVVFSPLAPWWERYEAVSYKLESGSGNETQFADMVTRCQAVGIRIYVDAVFNNMAQVSRWGVGSGGSIYDSDFKKYPGVPYDKDDFNSVPHCPSLDTFVHNYSNPDEVRNCSYNGRADLDQSQDHVQKMVLQYLNHLIDLGVAGFRIDSAKYMWPQHLEIIQNKLKDLPEGGRPFIFHDVEDYGNDAIKTSEYTDLGYVTEFRYGRSLTEILKGTSNLTKLASIQSPGMTPSNHALVFVDNHEIQRGIHQEGFPWLSFKDRKLYTMATAFTLAYNYGFVRVMSSFNFTKNTDGPPFEIDMRLHTKNVTILPDGSCGNGWVCEHRWPVISSMVRFRNAVNGTNVNHWKSQSDFVAFSRGHVGFFAMTTGDGFHGEVKTNLPAGRYCELTSNCGTVVTVDGHGSALLDMDGNASYVVAILTDWPAPAMVTTTVEETSLMTTLHHLYSPVHSDIITATTALPEQSIASNTPSSGLGHLSASFPLSSNTVFPGLSNILPTQSTHQVLYPSMDATARPIQTLNMVWESSFPTSSPEGRPETSAVMSTSTSSQYVDLSSASHPSSFHGTVSSGVAISSSQYPFSPIPSELLSSEATPQISMYFATSSAFSNLLNSETQVPSTTISQFTISPTPVVSLTTQMSLDSAFTTLTTQAAASPSETTSTHTEPTAASSTIPSPFRRTMVLLHWVTHQSEHVFFRGGIDHGRRAGCDATDLFVSDDPCAIPIRDCAQGNSSFHVLYNKWRVGDNYLDWHGKELTQVVGSEGTPSIWTSNNPSDPGYNPLNRYGDHFWLMDVEMDCSKTENGFFEVKGLSGNRWEVDIPARGCGGTGSYTHPPYASKNHFARCGYLNVFKDGGSCEIQPIPSAAGTCHVTSRPEAPIEG